VSTIAFNWSAGKPPAPDVYTTRRNQSKYLTKRYWDGNAWFEVGFGSRRGGIPFTWPKKTGTPMSKWEREANKAGKLTLRRISKLQGVIEWGDPYRVFNEREVLAYLVKACVLPADWRTCYQDQINNYLIVLRGVMAHHYDDARGLRP